MAEAYAEGPEAVVVDYFSMESGATILGVFSGIALGEFVGELVVTSFGLREWTAVGVRGAIKIPSSIAIYWLSRGQFGAWKLFGYALSAGIAASFIADVVAELIPGSPGWASKKGQQIGEQLASGTFLSELKSPSVHEEVPSGAGMEVKVIE